MKVLPDYRNIAKSYGFICGVLEGNYRPGKAFGHAFEFEHARGDGDLNEHSRYGGGGNGWGYYPHNLIVKVG